MRKFLKLYSLPLIVILIGLCAYFIAYIVFIVLSNDENFAVMPQATTPQTSSANIESTHKYQPLDSYPPKPTAPKKTQKAQESYQSPPPAIAQDSNPAPSERIHSIIKPQNPTTSADNPPQATFSHFVIARSNVRKAPSKDAQIITKVSENDIVEVLEDLGQWSKIRTKSHINGYIATHLLEKRLSQTYRVIANKLNVRAKADEKSTILTQLNHNTMIEVLSIENVKWAKIILPNKQQGFVSLEFIAKE